MQLATSLATTRPDLDLGWRFGDWFGRLFWDADFNPLRNLQFGNGRLLEHCQSYQAGWWRPCPECGDPPTAINHAAIDVGGTMYDLGIGDWSATSFASGINDRGQVVGGVDEGNGYYRAFLWTPETPNGTTGTMQRLADSPSGAAFANEINDAGQVVGIDYYAGTALLWSGGQVVELRSPIEGGSSNANDINAYGQIALGASDSLSSSSSTSRPVRQRSSTVSMTVVLSRRATRATSTSSTTTRCVCTNPRRCTIYPAVRGGSRVSMPRHVRKVA